MADNVLGAVKIEISGDWSRLEVDFKSAEKAAQSSGAKIASSMTVSMQQSAAATDQFSAAIDRLIAAQSRENAALSLSIQRNAAMQQSMSSTASGIRNVGRASQEAGEHVRGFVGVIPMLGRAAEHFVNLIPGLGAGIMAIFPVLGAIAFGEALVRIAGNVADIAREWDPVLSAEKRATEQAKEFSAEIAKVRTHLQAMADTKFGDRFGTSAMQAKQAADKEAELKALYAQLDMAQRRAANPTGGTAGAVGTAIQIGQTALPGLSILGDRFKKGVKIDAATATQDVVLLQSRIREVEDEQRQLSRKSIETHLNDQVKVHDKANAEAEKAAKREQEGWENRYQLFEKALKETQSARDKDLEDEKRYQDQLAEQKERWVKINIDAKRTRETKEAAINAPLEERLSPAAFAALELRRARVETTNTRESDIAEGQRLLGLAQQINVPLGTQLRMREQILQKQIELREDQGQSTQAELMELDAIHAKISQIAQRAAGLAPMFHQLRGIGGQVPGQLGGALAGGLVSGSPGKAIGQEIRGALQGIGHQILGTVFQQLISTILVQTGVQTALTAMLGVNATATGVNAAATTGNTAATALNTFWLQIKSFLGFADGGRPPLGVPSIVGERGPEMFIPDQAGRIVPNHQLTGGAGLMLPLMAAVASNSIGTMNFHAHGMTNPKDFVREVARQLPAYLKSTNPKYSPAAR